MRQEGRAPAWAELEDRLSSNIGLLVGSGLVAVNQWVSMMIDIEGFRKQEQGTGELPQDLLERWLSSPAPPPAETIPVKPLRRRGASRRGGKSG